MEGLVARRLLKDVSVVDLVRRSFTVTPRLFLLLLPVLAPVFFAVAYVAVGVGFEPDDAQRSAWGAWGLGRDRTEARADHATSIVSGALVACAVFAGAALSSIVSVAAIRSAFGERARWALLADGLRRSGASGVGAGAVLGVASLFAYGLCFFPGPILLAFVLPFAVVVAVERKGAGAALSRAVELTRGARFHLFGAVFLLWFFVGFALQLASLFAPRNIYTGEDTSHLWIDAVAVTAVGMFAAVWQAAMMALAYGDLRVRAERLEIDAVAQEVGGGAVVGIDRDAQAVSADGLVMRRRARRTIVVLIASAFGLGVCGLVFYPIARGKWEEHQRDRRYALAEKERERDRARVLAELTAARSARPDGAATDEGVFGHASRGDHPRPPSLPAEPPPPAKSMDEIVAALGSSDEAVRHEALAKDVAPLAGEVWGAGVAPVLRQLPKAPPDERELAILPGLGSSLRAYGCSEALGEARGAEPAEASQLFAKTCPPPPEPRAVDPASVKGVPLWAGALAVALSLKAKDFDKTKDPLHKAVVAALKKER